MGYLEEKIKKRKKKFCKTSAEELPALRLSHLHTTRCALGRMDAALSRRKYCVSVALVDFSQPRRSLSPLISGITQLCAIKGTYEPKRNTAAPSIKFMELHLFFLYWISRTRLKFLAPLAAYGDRKTISIGGAHEAVVPEVSESDNLANKINKCWSSSDVDPRGRDFTLHRFSWSSMCNEGDWCPYIVLISTIMSHYCGKNTTPVKWRVKISLYFIFW